MKKKILAIATIITILTIVPVSFYLGFLYSTSKRITESISSVTATSATTATTSSTKEISLNSTLSFQTALDEEASVYATDKMNAEFPDDKLNCKTIEYQQGMNRCSAYKVTYFTDRLDKEYEKIVSIFNLDKAELYKIKKQWMELVNQECGLYVRNEGGTLQPLEENGCKISLLKDKIIFVNAYLP